MILVLHQVSNQLLQYDDVLSEASQKLDNSVIGGDQLRIEQARKSRAEMVHKLLQ